jgi:hypothetical protein
MAWTQKKENFCLAYIRLGDASAAYREAYNAGKMKPQTVCKRASELMDDGEITGRLTELRASALEKANVTVEYIVSNLVELVERCTQRAPVVDSKGRQVQDDEGRDVWCFDSRGANAALATLAKYKGMLTEKREIELSGSVGVNVFDPETRAKLIEGLNCD